MEPSIDHQAVESSIAHQVVIFFHLLPSPFLEKGKFESLVALSFPRHNFQFKSWEYLFPQASWRGRKWLILEMEKKGKYNGHLGIILKEWKGVGIMLRGWNLKEISQTLSGLVA